VSASLFESCLSPPVVHPEFNGTGDVSGLRSLGATAQQKHERLFVPAVVHAVPRPKVKSNFRHAIAQQLVVAEVGLCHPIDASENGNASVDVFQPVKPRLEYIDSRCREVMPDFHLIFAYKRKGVKSGVPPEPRKGLPKAVSTTGPATKEARTREKFNRE
jgi:hypothetical protein